MTRSIVRVYHHDILSTLVWVLSFLHPLCYLASSSYSLLLCPAIYDLLVCCSPNHRVCAIDDRRNIPILIMILLL